MCNRLTDNVLNRAYWLKFNNFCKLSHYRTLITLLSSFYFTKQKTIVYAKYLSWGQLTSLAKSTSSSAHVTKYKTTK